MGVSQFTYIWWERDRYLPHDTQWEKIVEFLGYYPLLESISELNWILAIRRQLGLSKSKIAKLLKIDETTFAKLENGHRVNGADNSYDNLIHALKNLGLYDSLDNKSHELQNNG